MTFQQYFPSLCIFSYFMAKFYRSVPTAPSSTLEQALKSAVRSSNYYLAEAGLPASNTVKVMKLSLK